MVEVACLGSVRLDDDDINWTHTSGTMRDENCCFNSGNIPGSDGGQIIMDIKFSSHKVWGLLERNASHGAT